MLQTDLAWLAGIWEGEGSILLYSRTHSDKRIQITPNVVMSNSDIHIVNKCRKIIEEMGCNFSWREYKPKGKETYLTQYKISSAHAGNIKIFLEHILPYLVGNKKAYAETLLAFVSRRVEKAKEQGKLMKHLKYDNEDFEFIRSSTTTREAVTALVTEDIVYS